MTFSGDAIFVPFGQLAIRQICAVLLAKKFETLGWSCLVLSLLLRTQESHIVFCVPWGFHHEQEIHWNVIRLQHGISNGRLSYFFQKHASILLNAKLYGPKQRESDLRRWEHHQLPKRMQEDQENDKTIHVSAGDSKQTIQLLPRPRNEKCRYLSRAAWYFYLCSKLDGISRFLVAARPDKEGKGKDGLEIVSFEPWPRATQRPF